MINDDNDDVVNAFMDDELVVVTQQNQPISWGTMVHLFLWTLNDNNIKKHGQITHSMRALQ
jgi:hypothetical protein